jgi:hypothetical protein
MKASFICFLFVFVCGGLNVVEASDQKLATYFKKVTSPPNDNEGIVKFTVLFPGVFALGKWEQENGRYLQELISGINKDIPEIKLNFSDVPNVFFYIEDDTGIQNNSDIYKVLNFVTRGTPLESINNLKEQGCLSTHRRLNMTIQYSVTLISNDVNDKKGCIKKGLLYSLGLRNIQDVSPSPLFSNNEVGALKVLYSKAVIPGMTASRALLEYEGTK